MIDRGRQDDSGKGKEGIQPGYESQRRNLVADCARGSQHPRQGELRGPAQHETGRTVRPRQGVRVRV